MMTWLADAIRAEGAKVVETNGWKTRGWGSDSDFVGGRGVMEHHTASSKTAGNAPALGFVTTGSSIAPLCNLLIGRDGTVFVVAAGKANHGGLGGPWRTVPKDSANTYTVGIEIENNGIGEPYPTAQILAVMQSTKAILERQKHDAEWAVAHKEWAPTRKIDPSFSMSAFRADLKDFMEGGDELPFLSENDQKQLKVFLDTLRNKMADNPADDPPVTAKGAAVRLGQVYRVVKRKLMKPEDA